MEQIHVWKQVAWLAPVICVFIGGLILFYANNKIHKLEAEIQIIEQKKSSKTGTITPAKVKPIFFQKYITILIGSNKYEIDRLLLISDSALNPFKGSLISIPLSIKLSKEGNLLVNCTFRDLSGKIVAELTENEWEVNPNNFFKRNYDDHGLEVIDQEGIMKLQIDFINNETLKIGGIIRDINDIHFISERMVISSDLRAVNKEEIIKSSEIISNMFVYPADKYFGKRAK